MNAISLRMTALRAVIIGFILASGFTLDLVDAATGQNASPQPKSDSLGATVTDIAITANVKSKLLREGILKNSDINVSTTNGVVTLSGSIANPDNKSKIDSIAKNVDGVKSIDDRLNVAENRTVANAKRGVSDNWITTKVKSKILADNAKDGLKVDVTTKRGAVALKGILPNEDDVERIKNIAEKVAGVKSVDTSALTASSK